MKILQLVESAAAGVGRHVVDLTSGLLSRGHEVHLVYSEMRADTIFGDDLRVLGLSSKFRASRIPMRRQPCGGDVHASIALRRYLRSHGRFDLVHCHSTKAGLIGRFSLIGHSVKKLYTPHMFYSMQPNQRALVRFGAATLESALARLSHAVVVVSKEERGHALEMGIPASKLCLIPNGARLDGIDRSPGDRRAIRHSWGLGEAEVCVGFVGRLVGQKSPETMLKSFAALQRLSSIPVRLVMVGDGPLNAELRQLSTNLCIETRVTWLGESDAKLLMHAFDVLALTSDSEGHSLVVLEAMARGLPIVATSVGGIAETVQHGINGFIAPVRGVVEIAAALDVLVRDAGLREEMSRASRALSQNFSIDRMVDRTVALYERMISGERTATASQEWEPATFR